MKPLLAALTAVLLLLAIAPARSRAQAVPDPSTGHSASAVTPGLDAGSPWSLARGPRVSTVLDAAGLPLPALMSWSARAWLSASLARYGASTTGARSDFARRSRRMLP